MNDIISRAKVVTDLDYLRDFLNIGCRFATQERHDLLRCLLTVALAEIDRIQRMEDTEQQQRSTSAAPAASKCSGSTEGPAAMLGLWHA